MPMPQLPATTPELVRKLVVDTSVHRLGLVLRALPERYVLRPTYGGPPWTAEGRHLLIVEDGGVLAARADELGRQIREHLGRGR